MMDKRISLINQLVVDLAIIVHDAGSTLVAARILRRRGIPFDTAMRVFFDTESRRNTEVMSKWRKI